MDQSRGTLVWRHNQKAIRGVSFQNVRELPCKINTFVAQDNAQTSPCVWVATAESILAKIQ